jgi:hypothetical protein
VARPAKALIVGGKGGRLATLYARWVHVFEEDSERGAVYRREDAADLPLSRRPRERLEIEPDGTVRLLAAGPDDRFRERTGTWTEVSGEVIIQIGLPSGARAARAAKPEGGEYRIVERSPDRLVILKPGR